MKKYQNLLIVGFDGLDYEKIREYGCETLQRMESFGKMDTEGIKLSTPPLWASFLTGERPEVHGIESMLVFSGEKVRKVDGWVTWILYKFGITAMHLRRAIYYYLFESGQKTQDKEFMKVDSVFEKVANSKALTVPGYTEYPYIAGKSWVGKAMRKRSPISRERVLRDMEAEHHYRKKRLFEEMGDHTVLMQHFHYPDWYQHLFYKDEEGEREMYLKIDELAGKVLEKAGDDTLVLFCSDHGLEGGGHRDQAFFASNADLPDNVGITEVLDLCLEKVEYEKKEEVVEELEI